jgi:hypothetical protein
MSHTPSARRRKKRGIAPSSTLPRGEISVVPGATWRPSEMRSFSSPPVPCSSNNGGSAASSGGT